MRERFDAGAGCMAIGAVLLLVSLFVDWYEPDLNAWTVFEWVDVFLAGVALAVLASLVSRRERLPQSLVLAAFAAVAVVLVQLVDLPPAVRGQDREAGVWLALGASALMALGAAMAVAGVSVTVDVHERQRRRRTAAVDARETAPPPPPPRPTAEPPTEPARPGRRLFAGDRPAEPPPGEDPQRTQSLDPVNPAETAPGATEPRP